MTGELCDLEREDYRQILDVFQECGEWERTSKTKGDLKELSAICESVAEGSEVVELRYEHCSTEGLLDVRIPKLDNTSGAVYAALEQPLDSSLNSNSDSSFLEQVGDVHCSIASRYSSEYLNPVSDQYVVLEITVPPLFSSKEIEQALKSADMASREVGRFHDSLLEVFDGFSA